MAQLSDGEPGLSVRTKLNYYLGLYATPEEFGALGDGSTNDAAAIQAAVDTGLPVYFAEKNYRISTPIAISSNTRMIGSGPGSTISVVTNIAIFNVIGSKIQIANLRFLGNGGTNAQKGIAVVGNAGLTLPYYSIVVDGCIFEDLNHGMYCTLVVGSDVTNFQEGVYYASNNIAINCTIGYFCDTRGEYCSFSNCVAYKCTTGVRFNGGNNSWIGGQVVNNTNGFYIGTGTNDGHGLVSGCKINHNTTSGIICDNTDLGYLFVNCMLYSSGTVNLLNAASGIRFVGCEFSGTSIGGLSTALKTVFDNCKFIDNPTINNPSNAKFFNNYWDTGTINQGIFNTLQGGLLLSQQAWTSGAPVGLTLTGGAHTGLTASTEASDVNLNLARTVQFATGALTTQRAFKIAAPTYGFVGASTLTKASTLAISGPPVAGTNATITNAYALDIESGNAYIEGKIIHAATNTAGGTTGAQTINRPTGSVNFAAGASTLVVTNSLATATSQIFVTVYGTDATATSARVTRASGSFTITLNAAATAETAVGFMVIN